MDLLELFATDFPVIGVVHLPPLPGSPGYAGRWSDVEERVRHDVAALAEGGVHGLIVENYGDAPFYPRRVPPETVAHMTLLASAVRGASEVPVGINVLRNDAFSALAVASAVGARFVRVNVLTGARLTDQGIVAGEAHELLRYRRALGSGAHLFADVAVKHSAPLAVRPLAEEVEDTVGRGGADAVIVSGVGTGRPASIDDLLVARRAAGGAPVLVGSGVTLDTLPDVVEHADGLIVGTALKEDGITANPVSPPRVRELMAWVRDRERPGL